MLKHALGTATARENVNPPMTGTASPEAVRVVLGDPSGQAVAGARRALGKKLAKVYPSHAELLKAEKAALALVTLESRGRCFHISSSAPRKPSPLIKRCFLFRCRPVPRSP
jgi:hypothetical protein